MLLDLLLDGLLARAVFVAFEGRGDGGAQVLAQEGLAQEVLIWEVLAWLGILLQVEQALCGMLPEHPAFQ